MKTFFEITAQIIVYGWAGSAVLVGVFMVLDGCFTPPPAPPTPTPLQQAETIVAEYAIRSGAVR